MKHEVTTLNTKKTLAASLKKAMGKKPLSKITVSEIIGDCGVNRKTFYYHFEDIYGLLKWMVEQEAVEVVKQFYLMVDFDDAIQFVIDYVDANKHILNCAYDSMGRDVMKRFFYADFIGILRTIVDGTEKELSMSVTEDFKIFLCNLYAEALAGILIDWFQDKKARDRENTLQYISLIFRASLPQVIASAAAVGK